MQNNLWQEWLNLQALIQEAKKTAICNMLTLDAFALARLGQQDEGVYDHLVYLMETYRDVVQIFEQDANDPVPEQVAGLCDVLNSRRRQFEDVAPSPGNPIANEKRVIIEKNLLHLYEAENPESIYQELLNLTLSQINDLHNRTQTSFYTDLLEREWEVLGLIISIQVTGIEAIWGMEYAHAPLSKLREAYQQTGPVISGFRKLIKTTPKVTPPSPDFDFHELIVDNQTFLASLEQEADLQFEKIKTEHMEFAKSLEEKIDDKLNLSEEIISTFGAADFWLTNTPKPKAPPESEIIAGIIETIRIKIDSLKESMEQFKETTKTEYKPAAAPNDYITQLYSSWISNPPTPDTLYVFFENAEIFTVYSEKLVKDLANVTTKLDKQILRYQKENLLYEISTYEEILYYSVSRLRDSELPQVQTAVEILDETFVALGSILEEKGISVIQPNPHDPFVAREHEILTAEQHDGFVKGEIIKTMTSGYKQGDQVILRANVVAAR